MLTQILTLIHTLQQDFTSILQWFNINQMKANLSKFQAISFGKRGTRDITNFTFENTTIYCENSIVFLGIEIDHLLTFNTHIANICKKAARQSDKQGNTRTDRATIYGRSSNQKESPDRLPKKVLYSQLSSGHRKRGRPHLRFKDTIKRNLKLR